MRILYFIVVFFTITCVQAQDQKASFEAFLTQFHPATLPFSCCEATGKPVQPAHQAAFLSQIQSNEEFYDFNNPYYGHLLLKKEQYIVFTVFNATLLDKEQGYDETVYLCTFTPQGQFIDCVVVYTHNLRKAFDETTKRFEDTTSQITANGVIQLRTIHAQEYLNPTNEEKVIDSKEQKATYHISPQGHIVR
ncbi:MAG: hypothetical protein ACFB0B_11000 [Thermonemataceae bacterium]